MVTNKQVHCNLQGYSLICERDSDCCFLLQSVNNYSVPVVENLSFAKACGCTKGTIPGYSVRCGCEWRV